MTRGIHLKQLKSADLHAIGVSNDWSGETADDENGRPLGRLVEADPVLAQTLEEVRGGSKSDPFTPGRGPGGKPPDTSPISAPQAILNDSVLFGGPDWRI